MRPHLHAALALALCLGCGATRATTTATGVSAAPPAPGLAAPLGPEEDIVLPGPGRHHALRGGRVTALVGAAQLVGRGALRLGAPVPRGSVLRTASPDDLVEVTFSDGTLVRLSGTAHLTVADTDRAVVLRAGDALVQADRMVGGLHLLTPAAVCLTEGTTYLARVRQSGDVEFAVLSGIVQVARPGDEVNLAQRGPGGGARLLVNGERLQVARSGAMIGPLPYGLTEALARDLLLSAAPGSGLALAGLRGVADQQRRGVLARYGERLRHEIRWQRRRTPIVLPPLFQPDPP